MKSLIVESTAKTPHILFSAETGSLEISGRSIPENSAEFYQPVYDWLDQYSLKPLPETMVKIQLEYFNTSSSKCLLDVFRRLEVIHKSERSIVHVKWMYEEEDEDMMEAGDDYRTIVLLPFELVKI
jgi:hypothetical protein